jgi:hypothetical protein
VRKREPQTILKTEEHNLLLEVGRDGKFGAKTVGLDNTGFSLEGEKLEIAVKNGHPALTHLPAAPRPAVQ